MGTHFVILLGSLCGAHGASLYDAVRYANLEGYIQESDHQDWKEYWAKIKPESSFGDIESLVANGLDEELSPLIRSDQVFSRFKYEKQYNYLIQDVRNRIKDHELF